MPIISNDTMLLQLPAGTTPEEAGELDAALTNGVGAVLAELALLSEVRSVLAVDAPAVTATAPSAPTRTPRKMPPRVDICGQPTKSGEPCGMPPTCRHHNTKQEHTEPTPITVVKPDEPPAVEPVCASSAAMPEVANKPACGHCGALNSFATSKEPLETGGWEYVVKCRVCSRVKAEDDEQPAVLN